MDANTKLEFHLAFCYSFSLLLIAVCVEHLNLIYLFFPHNVQNAWGMKQTDDIAAPDSEAPELKIGYVYFCKQYTSIQGLTQAVILKKCEM